MDIVLSKSRLFKTGFKRFGAFLSPKMRFSEIKKRAVILGIETSCDDTGCAIVDSEGNILGEALHSQLQTHIDNGGIIPPLAQEMHKQKITEVCEKTLKSANMRLRDLDAIATTTRPGMPLSLIIGTNFGKYLSKVGNKPFIPIHHMEAHALTARMKEKVDFPFLVLLISGGHCLLALVKDATTFYLLGQSKDDAPGTVSDKVARRLKIHNIPEYSNMSGGSAIELAASRATDPLEFSFELFMAHYRDCNFSFGGLRNTADTLIRKLEIDHEIIGDRIIPNLNNFCASYQLAMTRHICHRTKRAMEFCNIKELIPPENRTLVVSGGVACNNFIAKALSIVCEEMGYRLVRPPPHLCTDNGIMIAWNGVERWVTDKGVLRDPEEIQKLDFKKKAPLGEDWTQKVIDANIACKAIKTTQLY